MWSRRIQIAIEIALARLYERGRTNVSLDEIMSELAIVSPDLKRWQVKRSIVRMDNGRDCSPDVWEAGKCGCDRWNIDERLVKLLRLTYPEKFGEEKGD